MSPARKPIEPRRLLSVHAHNGDHEVVLRVSKRTRYFLVACLLALIFSGTGTTMTGLAEAVRLVSGLMP